MAPIGIEPITHGLQGKKTVAVRITIMIHRSYVALPVELWGHVDIKKSDALVATSDPGKEFRLLRQAEKKSRKKTCSDFHRRGNRCSGSWQNTEWWAAALQTVTISRSGPDTEKHGRLCTVKVHCVMRCVSSISLTLWRCYLDKTLYLLSSAVSGRRMHGFEPFQSRCSAKIFNHLRSNCCVRPT